VLLATPSFVGVRAFVRASNVNLISLFNVWSVNIYNSQANLCPCASIRVCVSTSLSLSLSLPPLIPPSLFLFTGTAPVSINAFMCVCERESASVCIDAHSLARV